MSISDLLSRIILNSKMSNLKAFIKKDTKNTRVLERIRDSISDIEYIRDKSEIISESDSISAKRIIYIEDGDGELIEKCPGTLYSRCCNYYVIKNIINCPMVCSYCYLQTFLNQDYITVYTDIDSIICSLEKKSKELGRIRIGTGEYSDSFALEAETGYTEFLTQYCQDKPGITMEFKTKYAGIEPFPNKRGNIIYGVTFEPEIIRDEEEENTSSIQDRIGFLQRAIEKNNKVALHFDPIIFTDDCFSLYEQLIRGISKHIEEKHIAYISLGCMRFSKGLINNLLDKFPKSRILQGEYILCRDTKYRYPREIRVSIFKNILKMIRKRYKNAPVYLCMENKTVWSMVYKEYGSFSDSLFS